jgi:hypothetical protein
VQGGVPVLVRSGGGVTCMVAAALQAAVFADGLGIMLGRGHSG